MKHLLALRRLCPSPLPRQQPEVTKQPFPPVAKNLEILLPSLPIYRTKVNVVVRPLPGAVDEIENTELADLDRHDLLLPFYVKGRVMITPFPKEGPRLPQTPFR